MIGLRAFSRGAVPTSLVQDKETPEARGKHATLMWLLGCIGCYQLCCQYYMKSAVQQLDEEGTCDFGHPSPHCAEQQLFHSWRAAAVAEDLLQLEGFLQEEHPPAVAPEATSSAKPIHAAAAQPATLATTATPLPPSGPTAAAPPPPGAPVATRSAAAATASAPPSSAPGAAAGAGLLEEIAQVKCQMCLETRHRGYPECAEFANATGCSLQQLKRLQDRKGPALRAVSSTTEAPQQASASGEVPLLEEITEARCEMCSQPQHRDYPECALFRDVADCSLVRAAELHQRSSMQAWAGGLEKLQAHLEVQKSHGRVHHAAGDPARTHGEKPLAERIKDVGCDLCLDPERRDRPECARFLATPSCRRAAGEGDVAFEMQTHELAEQHSDWERRFTKQIEAVRLELCASPERKDNPACAEQTSNGMASGGSPAAAGGQASSLRGAGSPPAAGGRTSSLRGSGGSASLRWPKDGWAAEAWTAGPFGRWSGARAAASLGPAALRRSESSQWQGKIPKVTCVTVIPSDPAVLRWLPSFVASFRKQTYEGPHELVLVYHFSNREAAQLAQKHADGALIRAVPAGGDSHFPSTAAFRFGAWSADTDLVARWDFDAWHHPERLALQVRAMALAARPACLVGSVAPQGAHSQAAGLNESAAAYTGGEQTLVGEVAWMKAHWYPLLEVKPLLESVEAGRLVVLRMPELHISGGSEKSE